MRRRAFFGTLLAALAAPFVAKAVAPPGLMLRRDAFALTSNPPPVLKLFATLPAPIEAVETIKTNGGDDMLLVLAGGLGYLVDQHGTVTRL